MAVRIVEADPSHEALIHRAAGLFDAPIQPIGLKRFLADPRHILLLAVDGERPIGFLTAVELFHPDRAVPELFVNELGVADDRHREGVGRAMVEEIRRTATRRGAGLAWVLAESGDERADAFYRGVGGRASGARLYEFGPTGAA